MSRNGISSEEDFNNELNSFDDESTSVGRVRRGEFVPGQDELELFTHGPERLHRNVFKLFWHYVFGRGDNN